MRDGKFKFAISKIKNIVAAGRADGYTNILKDKAPAAKSELDVRSD